MTYEESYINVDDNIQDDQSNLNELEELLKQTHCTVDLVSGFYQNGVNNTERMMIWKWLLGVSGSSITDWDTPVEHKDIDTIKEEVSLITDNTEEQEKMIKILSYYCTARNTRYKAGCGWSEVLLPLSLMSYGDMYAAFYAIISKFVPRNCKTDGKPFHLFRLLLLYHDPELCAFLDTKKCTPELYAQRWFRSLYVGKCEIHVVREMWTRYFLHGDPFMVFYLGLVVLVNARDVILNMDDCNNSEIAGALTTFPDKLSVEDVEDFVSLARYYAARTPISFTHDYHGHLFGNAPPTESNFAALSQVLCLPISVSELLHKTSNDGINYLVVDCRPKIQFDSGHLPGAIHLDPDTMLADPAMFTTSVAVVLVTQSKTFLEEELSSNHLCFMGSGREEEDQLLNMVAAHFLHRKTQFVSTARDGYKALHELLDTDVDNGLEDHRQDTCIVCTEELSSRMSQSELMISSHSNYNDNLVAKMSSVMRVTSDSVKNKIGSKITSLWAEEVTASDRHVKEATKSKPYRGMESVFSIADDDEDDVVGGGSSSEEDKEIINISVWEKRSDITHHYECEEITPDGKMLASVIMLTITHMYLLQKLSAREGMASIRFRHSYADIARITAKKKYPDVITFKFIKNNTKLLQTHRFLIPNAKTVTTLITSLIPPENQG